MVILAFFVHIQLWDLDNGNIFTTCPISWIYHRWTRIELQNHTNVVCFFCFIFSYFTEQNMFSLWGLSNTAAVKKLQVWKVAPQSTTALTSVCQRCSWLCSMLNIWSRITWFTVITFLVLFVLQFICLCATIPLFCHLHLHGLGYKWTAAFQMTIVRKCSSLLGTGSWFWGQIYPELQMQLSYIFF